LKIFEEGYDKDYIYEEKKYIPIIQEEQVEMNTLISNKSDHLLNNLSKRGLIGGSPPILLTMRGAIKFNMWKRTEGGKMIASALIEMDYKMILQVKDERIENICK